MLVTLDYGWIIFYGLVTIFQRKVKRNQRIIDYCNNVIQFRKGLKSTQIIYEEKIESNRSCIFGVHPHGILATEFPVFMNFPAAGPWRYIAGLSSRAMLAVPFVGIILRIWGYESVDAKNLKKLMKSGRNIALFPGGF